MKCPDCLSQIYITDWKPHPGIDSKIRQFKCPYCFETCYKIPRGGELHRQQNPEPAKLEFTDFQSRHRRP